MRINMSLLFLFLCLFAKDLFARGVRFISPRNHQTIQSTLDIQIVAPHDKSVKIVPVMITKETGRKVVKWIGYLTPKNKFKLTVDISSFSAGKYEVEALYGSRGQEYDGDVDFFIQ